MRRKKLFNAVTAGVLAFSMVLATAPFTSGDTVKAEDTDEISYITRTVTLSDGTEIEVRDNGSVQENLSSQELVTEKLGAGINLGNTLEATFTVDKKGSVRVEGSTRPSKEEYGTAWGNTVSRNLINEIHSYGINTLRIPVAWSNGDNDDGTYTIDPVLLDRVEEVANYALDLGMYVIINDHWDNQWWGQFGACTYKTDSDGNYETDEKGNNIKIVDQETRDNAWVRYERYWTQICERFKDYSDHLIFEGANEELGSRLNDAIALSGPEKGYCKTSLSDTSVKALGGNLTEDEQYETTNKINQKFVDIVRGSGGNNEKRFLLIPGFNTNFEDTSDARFKMPSDPTNSVNKLLLSVHFYSPWAFCGDNGKGTYDSNDKKENAKSFSSLQRFKDDGYGIIVGECGVCNPNGVQSSVTKWFYDNFKFAQEYDACPVLWDTGEYFDRKTEKLKFKDIAEFYNAVNNADGDTSMTLLTAGKGESENTSKVNEAVDTSIWEKAGMHAYVKFQTDSWDYRNEYTSLDKSGGTSGWSYIKVAGQDATSENTKVTDVNITGDGDYTIGIETTESLLGAKFNMLGIATDIPRDSKVNGVKNYPDVKISNVQLKLNGNIIKSELKEDEGTDYITPVLKEDDPNYEYLFMNNYGGDEKESYPLYSQNEDKKLLPCTKIEISFHIEGLADAVADIASGNYVNQETGLTINGNVPGTASDSTVTSSPSADEEDFNSVLKAEDLKDLKFVYDDSSNLTVGKNTPAPEITAVPAATASAPAATAVPSESKQAEKVKAPGRPKIKKASYKGGKVIIKWSKVKGAKGYKVSVSSTNKFRKKTTVTVTAAKTSAVIKAKKLRKIKASKKYFIRVRAYVKDSGKNVYGKYSSIKRLKK